MRLCTSGRLQCAPWLKLLMVTMIWFGTPGMRLRSFRSHLRILDSILVSPAPFLQSEAERPQNLSRSPARSLVVPRGHPSPAPWESGAELPLYHSPSPLTDSFRRLLCRFLGLGRGSVTFEGWSHLQWCLGALSGALISS